MRVRREAVGAVRLLLAEAVEGVLVEPALEVRARVHAGGGVALEEDLVAAAGSALAAEEVVVADLVEGRRRRVRRDVAADRDAGALGAVHHDRGVPAQPLAVAALDVFVTGKSGLVLGRDRVDVIGRRDHRHVDVQFMRTLQEAQHDLACSLVAVSRDEGVERLFPFGGFFGIPIEIVDRIRILFVDRHPLTSFFCREHNLQRSRE